MKNSTPKIKPGWIFLSIMAVIYLVLFMYDQQLFAATMTYLALILSKIIPVLIPVYALIFLTHYFVNPKRIKKHLGKESGLKGTLFSIGAGILSSGPIYAWYPLLTDLRTHGLSDKLMAVFLYSRAVKIPVLIMLVYYFGLSFTITVTILIILFSVINGWLVEAICRRET